MKCLFCPSNQIYWSDYESSFGHISLCFNCCVQILPEETAAAKSCLICKNKFLPKFSWARVCLKCYVKQKGVENE
jgi:hypothetical protein